MFLNNPYPNIFPQYNPHYINYKNRLLPAPDIDNTVSKEEKNIENTETRNSNANNSKINNTINQLLKNIFPSTESDDLILLGILCLLCNSEKKDIFLILILVLILFDI